ncbi:MAG: XamI family restriction endonuclease [bacterium]
MIAPPEWTTEELRRARDRAEERFREERLQEPLEMYLGLFDEYQGVVEELLESTVDLTALDEDAVAEIISRRDALWAFRFLAGPPISEDDLKTLAETSLSPKALERDPEARGRILEVVKMGLDRRRFAWLTEGREPNEAERRAAVVASAALMAMNKTVANRRNLGKREQEAGVKRALAGAGMREVATRRIRTFDDAPAPGEFCGECTLGNRKADIVVRLWDSRVMPIECKVSNSAVNSVKRLNNDAAVKAGVWTEDFGTRHVVPAAVLSGVYELHNLAEAQSRGLTLFWAHALEELTEWIEGTKESPG